MGIDIRPTSAIGNYGSTFFVYTTLPLDRARSFTNGDSHISLASVVEGEDVQRHLKSLDLDGMTKVTIHGGFRKGVTPKEGQTKTRLETFIEYCEKQGARILIMDPLSLDSGIVYSPTLAYQ